MLAERFEALLEQERQAAQAYADLADQVSDPAAKEQFELIRREKLRHIELAERLLEIVE